jgi:hypothetical protein
VSDPVDQPPEPRWARWYVVAIQTLVWVSMLGGAWLVYTAGHPATAVLLGAVGMVTAVLSIRKQRASRRATDLGIDERGELRPQEFDFLIWTAIGLPILMVVSVVILLLSDAR